jgi:hypothetical protein
MDEIINALRPAFVYFDDIYYLIAMATILSTVVFVWIYFTLVKIQGDRERDAGFFKNLIRIWQKACVIPEGERDAQGHILFNEFVTEVENNGEICPVVIDSGFVRVMSQSEYKREARTKKRLFISPILFIISLAFGAIVFLANWEAPNIGNIVVGGIVPAYQIIMMFVIGNINGRKNKYRAQLFERLHESGEDFMHLIWPYVLQNNRPEEIPTRYDSGRGFAAEPRQFKEYGELPQEEIDAAAVSLEQQQRAEMQQTVIAGDRAKEFLEQEPAAEIIEMPDEEEYPAEDNAGAAVMAEEFPPEKETLEEIEEVMEKAVPDFGAEVEKAKEQIKEMEKATGLTTREAFAILSKMAQEKKEKGDKFSIDSIGEALEAEIRRRNGAA